VGGLEVKVIPYKDIVNRVQEMCLKASFDLGEDVYAAFKSALLTEKSETGKEILHELVENADIAKQNQVPMCQDTGTAVFIVELGQACRIEGGLLTDAINEGVAKGYSLGYLRSSMIYDPLQRKNTGDNTPAVIHIENVDGDGLVLHMTAKGGGAENMSALKMLKPSDGLEGIKEFILKTVREAGGNPCPPIIVGVGIGGTMEKATMLAKKALTRKAGEPNQDEGYAILEKELLEKINEFGIGPQGLGGKITALAVHIETYPTHIATMPVAVNLNCHASRHTEAII